MWGLVESNLNTLHRPFSLTIAETFMAVTFTTIIFIQWTSDIRNADIRNSRLYGTNVSGTDFYLIKSAAYKEQSPVIRNTTTVHKKDVHTFNICGPVISLLVL